MNQTVTQIQRLNTSEIQDKPYHWLITTQTGQRIQAKRIIDDQTRDRQVPYTNAFLESRSSHQ